MFKINFCCPKNRKTSDMRVWLLQDFFPTILHHTRVFVNICWPHGEHGRFDVCATMLRVAFSRNNGNKWLHRRRNVLQYNLWFRSDLNTQRATEEDAKSDVGEIFGKSILKCVLPGFVCPEERRSDQGGRGGAVYLRILCASSCSLHPFSPISALVCNGSRLLHAAWRRRERCVYVTCCEGRQKKNTKL